jgi:hypothetical protein
MTIEFISMVMWLRRGSRRGEAELPSETGVQSDLFSVTWNSSERLQENMLHYLHQKSDS